MRLSTPPKPFEPYMHQNPMMFETLFFFFRLSLSNAPKQKMQERNRTWANIMRVGGAWQA